MFRGWALSLLRRSGSEGLRYGEDDSSAAAFDLFLRAERCALPVQRCVGLRHATLSPSLDRVLTSRATVEIERVLAARAQLLEIERLAQPHGIRPIVLKGGLLALRPHDPLDLYDVDILVGSRSEADLLATLLDRNGQTPMSPPADWHLEPRGRVGLVNVEIHVGIRCEGDLSGLRARAQPIPGFPVFRRLAPADQCRHVLLHSAIHHPFRRGSLREALLLRAALDECDVADHTTLSHFTLDHERRDVLGRMLDFGYSIGDRNRRDDPFALEAAANYLFQTARWVRALPSRERGVLSGALFAQLGSAADRRAEWRTTLERERKPSRLTLMNTAERLWPAGSRLVRGTLRLSRLALAWFLAYLFKRAALRISARPRAPRDSPPLTPEQS